MKKLLATIFAIVLCLNIVSAQEFSAVCSSGQTLYYKVTGTSPNEVEVVKTPQGKKSPSETVVMPSSVTYTGITYSITSIGKSAFEGCRGLLSVTVPDAVTKIGESAFRYCEKLTYVNIPDAVTKIEEATFQYCRALTFIEMPNTITYIGKSAFEDCSGLFSVTIPNSVTCIGEEAFSYCSTLIVIEIPNAVTNIGENAFQSCGSLTAINVESGNTSFSSENGVLFNKNKTILIKYPSRKADIQYIIPNAVTNIGDNAFEYCSNLSSITIPNSVATIGYAAFIECGNLTSITIPNSVTEIGYDAFKYCVRLTAIDAENGNKNYISKNGVLFNKDKTTLIKYPEGKAGKRYAIPPSVTSIKGDAFVNCSSLTSIPIPNSVKIIGERAFEGCCGLTSVFIPNSVAEIGEGVFNNCSGLTHIKLSNALSDIGYLFYGCSALTSVTISKSVTDINAKDFLGCNNLSAINVVRSNTTYTSINGVLFNKDKTTLIKYPEGKTDQRYAIPHSVTYIGKSAFEGCQNLTVITLPNTVTSIGMFAFAGCSMLTDFVCEAVVPPSCDIEETFIGVYDTATLTVPCGSEDAYKSDNIWKLFADRIQCKRKP